MSEPEQSAANCPDGTVQSYAGTTCQHPGVTYTFPNLAGFFHNEGTVPLQPSDVHIIQDRSGPNTLLISSDQFFASRAGETVQLRLTFHVDRANGYAGFLNRPAVIGAGTARATMTINADPPVVVVSTPEQPQTYSDKYTPGPYRVELLIQLKSEGGEVSFGSYGAHFGVLP